MVINSDSEDKTKETHNIMYTESKLLRMRKDELLDIIHNLDLNIGEYQSKTKKQIAQGIMKTTTALNNN